MIQTLKAAYRKLKNSMPWHRTQWPEAISYPIQLAFTLDGVNYYQFTDTFNIPYERAIKAVTFNEEARLKCTYEWLTQWAEAQNKVLTSGKVIDLYEAKRLLDMLRERLNLAYDVEILYKFASIVYFTEEEDPRVYDYKYNARKIAEWKKHDVKTFFLQRPIVELMPFLTDAAENIQMYSEVTARINQIHSALLKDILIK